MSQLTDSLTTSMTALLASGQEIPASKVRQWGGQLIAAIGTLEARARGNIFHYTTASDGPPSASLGLEGDLGINVVNGDAYQFTGGQFVFLFNLLPRGTFDLYEVPVALRDWAEDAARTWFGPAGGEAIYCSDALPAGAIVGMSWDDPDTNISYDIRPIGYANGTRIVLRRSAQFAP